MRHPQDVHDHVRNIPLDLVITVVTCGLWNLVVQWKQMASLNYMLGEDRYNFWVWLLFTLCTCGLYHFYHEYRKSADLGRLLSKPDTNEAILSLVLCAVGLSFVADAVQQHMINTYFGDTSL